MNPARERRFSAGNISLLAPRSSLPWTICVLFYGNHPDLCSRFLEKLYRFTDPDAFRLRAGMNAVCRETRQILNTARRRHGNITLFPSVTNIFKCPMMRRLFHQPAPDTEWTIWFDDDSFVAHSGWIMELAIAIEKVPSAELFGSLRRVGVSDHLEQFILSAQWYRGISRRVCPETGRGTILFPVGGFWAVRTARLLETDWPDTRLQHFEDDYLMGEAMRQQGVEMVHFESGVRISDAPRRAPGDAPLTLNLNH